MAVGLVLSGSWIFKQPFANDMSENAFRNSGHPDGFTTWMSQEVSKRLVMGYNPNIPHLYISRL